MRARLSVAVLALAACGAIATRAQDKPDSERRCGGALDAAQLRAKKDCRFKGGARDCCRGKELPAGMPVMFYRVGDQQFCCEQAAAEQAGGGTIRFVLGQRSFERRADALKAYAEALQKYLERITTVQYAVGDKCVPCPVTAKTLARSGADKVRYRLAAYTFADQALAEQVARAARQAAEKVNLTWQVAEQSYDCPRHAEQAARKCGKPVQYRLGKTSTTCKLTAQVELAKARIAAAVRVIAARAGT